MRKEILYQPINRRRFLRLGGALLCGLLIEMSLPKEASAYPLYDSDSPNPDISPLEKYLKKIKLERKKFEAIVVQMDLFDGFKKLTTEERLEDLNMYFPMYKAGEIEYGIPWFLLWIIHVHETASSRDSNPDGKYHIGAVQRREEFFPDEEVKMAATGWEMLRNLPQRYCPENGWPHYDSDEILWAAFDLKRRAEKQKEKNPSLDFETSLLEGVKTYSVLYYGEQRVARYKIIKEILANNL